MYTFDPVNEENGDIPQPAPSSRRSRRDGVWRTDESALCGRGFGMHVIDPLAFDEFTDEDREMLDADEHPLDRKTNND